MKYMIFSLFALSLPVLSQAQVTTQAGASYREFEASITLCTGETKSITLKVNPELRVDRYGDPEIPYHGFHDYVITGSLVEAGKTCDFEALLTQADGQAVGTRQIIEMNTDRPYGIKTCSGLILSTSSLRALLVGESTQGQLRANGVEKSLGTGSITFKGNRTVQEDESCVDRWHCGPDYTGPRR